MDSMPSIVLDPFASDKGLKQKHINNEAYLNALKVLQECNECTQDSKQTITSLSGNSHLTFWCLVGVV